MNMKKTETSISEHYCIIKALLPGSSRIKGFQGKRDKRHSWIAKFIKYKQNTDKCQQPTLEEQETSLDLHHEAKTSCSKNYGLKTFE